jgi:cytochrome bd-type quinol oxidase subunit 2
MAFGFLVYIAIFCAALYHAYSVSRRTGPESRLLVVAPVPAVIVWVTATALGFGAQSLANIVEVFAIFALGIVLAYVKVFVVDKAYHKPLTSTYLLIGLLVVVAIILRATMPNLPE